METKGVSLLQSYVNIRNSFIDHSLKIKTSKERELWDFLNDFKLRQPVLLKMGYVPKEYDHDQT